jgi:hypothetical protein
LSLLFSKFSVLLCPFFFLLIPFSFSFLRYQIMLYHLWKLLFDSWKTLSYLFLRCTHRISCALSLEFITFYCSLVVHVKILQSFCMWILVWVKNNVLLLCYRFLEVKRIDSPLEWDIWKETEWTEKKTLWVDRRKGRIKTT